LVELRDRLRSARDGLEFLGQLLLEEPPDLAAHAPQLANVRLMLMDG
jgi:hypothetical protein